MSFNPFGQYIGQYNASLPTLTDGDFAVMALDVNGRVIITDGGQSITVDGTFWQATQPVSGTFWQATQPVSGPLTDAELRATPVPVSATDLDIRDLTHVSDSVKIGDGVDFLDILAWDAASGGAEKGLLPFAIRHDADTSLVGTDGDFAPLQVDSLGRLKVAGTFDVQVDDVFESGTEADAGSDAAGDGIVPILKASMSDVVTIPVGAGVTYYITGLDFSADDLAAYELIIDDDGTPTEWIRVGSITGNVDIDKSFERAIEIAGAADRSLILRAQGLKKNCNASGGINGYTR